MSPEQLRADADVDGRSDIYSLGVMAYECLTGRPPFVSDTVMRLAVQHLHEAPTPPRAYTPTVPLAIESLILRMLAKAPADRPADVASVRASITEIERAHGQGTLSATPHAAGPFAPDEATERDTLSLSDMAASREHAPAPRPERRRWWLPLVAAGGGAFAVVAFWPDASPPPAAAPETPVHATAAPLVPAPQAPDAAPPDAGPRDAAPPDAAPPDAAPSPDGGRAAAHRAPQRPRPAKGRWRPKAKPKSPPVEPPAAAPAASSDYQPAPGLF